MRFVKNAPKKPTKKVPKKPVNTSDITFTDNQIVNFEDIQERFKSIYKFVDCQLISLNGIHNLENIQTLDTKNALIFSFEGTKYIKSKITNVSFIGSPITKYPNYRLMALLAFGRQIISIDGINVSEEEKKIAHDIIQNKKEIQQFVQEGGLLRDDSDFDVEIIKKKSKQLHIAPVVQQLHGNQYPKTLLFVPFFNKESLNNEVAHLIDETSKTSLEHSIYTLQKTFRTMISNIKSIIPQTDTNPNEIKFKDIFNKINIERNHLDESIQSAKKVNSFHNSEYLKKLIVSAESIANALTRLDTSFQKRENEIQRLTDESFNKITQALHAIKQPNLAPYCESFIEVLQQSYDIMSDLIKIEHLSIDDIVGCFNDFSNVSTHIKSPILSVIDKLYQHVSNISFKYDSPELKKIQRALLLNKKFPTLNNFQRTKRTIQTKLATIDNNEIQRDANEIISQLDSLDLKIIHEYYLDFVHCNNSLNIKYYIQQIKLYQQSLLNQLYSIWAEPNIYNELNAFKNAVSKRQNEFSDIIENQKSKLNELTQFLNNDLHILFSLADQSYDSSLPFQQNSSLINKIHYKEDIIRQKQERIEYLKSLIENKK